MTQDERVGSVARLSIRMTETAAFVIDDQPCGKGWDGDKLLVMVMEAAYDEIPVHYSFGQGFPGNRQR